MINIAGGVTAPKGFYAGGTHCGLRKNRDKNDLALIYSKELCDAAAVYTQNLVKGAPLLVTAEHLKDRKAKAIICNSGNANTCNADGVPKARLTAKALSAQLGADPGDIIIASTGVIGQPLDVDKITAAIPALVNSVASGEAANESAALAIMTTDTVVKSVAVSFDIGGKEIRIGGIAKGSGMIHPNMATMLCFITTDAAIDGVILQTALSAVVKDTFNMVSVDGDTSTNDMVCVLAGGLAGNKKITTFGTDYELFSAGLYKVMEELSKKIAADGEGATKLLECAISGAPDKDTARICAKSVITSSLVKSAMFGADANWGRIVCALGYAGADIDVKKIDVSFSSQAGNIDVCKNGAGLAFDEKKAKEILLCGEIKINVDLNDGNFSASAWGCDLTYDYVKINGDYRT